jgi:Ni/Fe-hydrogenase 1 B-type cytochrome subunit
MATLIKSSTAGLPIVDKQEIAAVYVWEWPVRIFHWIMVLSLTVLTITGFYMHRPFLVETSSRAWAMGTARFIHELFGFILMSVMIVRLYWFFAGNRWARWRAWIPLTREQRRSFQSMVRYYTFRAREPFPEIGHNSLATATYLVIILLLVWECITGLVLYSVVRGSHLLTSLVGWIPRIMDIQYIRSSHYFVMFLFMAFLVHHVYSAILVSMESRNGLMDSIFSGWKFVPRSLLEEKAVDAGERKVRRRREDLSSVKENKP